MAGYFTMKGQINLLVKRLRRSVKPLIPKSLYAWLIAKRTVAHVGDYPWTSRVDVSSLGITNSYQLMQRFSEIVARSDECQKAIHDPLISGPSLSLRGQLNLPITVLNQVNDGQGL